MGTFATAVIVVEAPAACATVASFAEALDAGASRVRRGAGVDRIEVRAAPRGDGSVEGDVVIVRGGARSEERRVEGASCAEVVNALALVAALAWDDAPPETPLRVEALVPSLGSPPSPEAPSRRRAPGAWSLGAAPAVGTSALATDWPVVAWGAFMDVERTGSGFAPALRVGVSHAASTATRYAAQESVAWTYARVLACPVAGVAGGFSVRPCAQADVGAIREATAYDLRTATSAWVTAGVAVRLAWRSRHGVFVEIDPSFAVAATRPMLLPSGPVDGYRPPLSQPGLEIGVGYRFF